MKQYKQFKYTCKHVLDGEYVFHELRKCNFFYKTLFWLLSPFLVMAGMWSLLREED